MDNGWNQTNFNQGWPSFFRKEEAIP